MLAPIKLLACSTGTVLESLDTARSTFRRNGFVEAASDIATTLPNRNVARLLLHRLDEADRELIVAVLPTLRSKCFNDWQIVPQGPAHLALLVCEDAASLAGRAGDSAEKLQVPLAATSSKVQSVLQTPLRYSDFTRAFVAVDRWLAILRASPRHADGGTAPSDAGDARRDTALALSR